MASFDEAFDQYEQSRSSTQQPVQSGGDHRSVFDRTFDAYWDKNIRPVAAPQLESPSSTQVAYEVASSPIESAGMFVRNIPDQVSSYMTPSEPPQPADTSLPSRQAAIDEAMRLNPDYQRLHPVDRERLIDVQAQKLNLPTSQDLAAQNRQQTAGSAVDDMSWLERRSVDALQGVTGTVQAGARLAMGQQTPLAGELLADEIQRREPFTSGATQIASGFASPESLATFGLTQALLGRTIARYGAGARERIASLLTSRGVSEAAANRISGELVRQGANVALSAPISAASGAVVGAADAPEGEKVQDAIRGAVVGGALDIGTNIGLDTLARGIGRIRYNRREKQLIDRFIGRRTPGELEATRTRLAGREAELNRPNRLLLQEIDRRLGPRPVPVDEPVDIPPQQAAPEASPQASPEPSPQPVTEPVVTPTEPTPRVVDQPVSSPETPQDVSPPDAPATPQTPGRDVPYDYQVQGALGNNLEKGGNAFVFIDEKAAEAEVRRVNRMRGPNKDYHVSLEKRKDGMYVVTDPVADRYQPALQPTQQPTVTEPAVQPEATPQEAPPVSTPEPAAPEPAPQKLPSHLAKSSPRYGYGNKNFTLKFDDDIDKAAYIVANAKSQSKAESQFREFLKRAGLSDEQIAQRGKAVKDRIKAMARDAEKSGELNIPSSTKRKATNALQEEKVKPKKEAPADAAAKTKPAGEKQEKPARNDAETQPEVPERVAENAATGQKRQAVEERQNLALKELSPTGRVRWQESTREAIESGEVDKAIDIASAVSASPRPLTPTETAAIVVKMAEIKADRQAALRAIRNEKNPQLIESMSAGLDRLRQDMDILTQAIYITSPENARALGIRGMMAEINEYDYSTLVSRAKARAKRELTDVQKQKIKNVADSIESMEAELASIQDALPRHHANRVIESKAINIKESLNAIKQNIDGLLKAGCRIG